MRPARREDTGAIARIYNEGIEDGFATFETRTRRADSRRSEGGQSLAGGKWYEVPFS